MTQFSSWIRKILCLRRPLLSRAQKHGSCVDVGKNQGNKYDKHIKMNDFFRDEVAVLKKCFFAIKITYMSGVWHIFYTLLNLNGILTSEKQQNVNELSKMIVKSCYLVAVVCLKCVLGQISCQKTSSSWRVCVCGCLCMCVCYFFKLLLKRWQ